uniref:Uncharacterized protein TCIL3000_11_9930 n=1 Tax=Trypanosoma congolense (strain IL3000) TaxID=1068625 RepID=G0V1K0_TRYCI|nr:unnamed protein product [Trypanosoma congolense IL3000]
MNDVVMPWMYKALISYARSGALHSGGNARLNRMAPSVPQTHGNTAPNLLISQSSHGGPSALWLLHQPDRVVGLVVSPQHSGKEVQEALYNSCALRRRRRNRVIQHLQSHPFRVAGHAPLCLPMVVHKNHLIGWYIDGSAAPLYAHSLDQLSQLKPTQLSTISPDNAFICQTYYEWDNWREVSMEPGWSWHRVDEGVANGILYGNLTFEQLRISAAEAS